MSPAHISRPSRRSNHEQARIKLKHPNRNTMLHCTLQLSLRAVPTISPAFIISYIGLAHTSIAFSRSHSFHLNSDLSSSRSTLTFEHKHHKIMLDYTPLQRINPRMIHRVLHKPCTLTNFCKSSLIHIQLPAYLMLNAYWKRGAV